MLQYCLEWTVAMQMSAAVPELLVQQRRVVVEDAVALAAASGTDGVLVLALGANFVLGHDSVPVPLESHTAVATVAATVVAAVAVAAAAQMTEAPASAAVTDHEEVETADLTETGFA